MKKKKHAIRKFWNFWKYLPIGSAINFKREHKGLQDFGALDSLSDEYATHQLYATLPIILLIVYLFIGVVFGDWTPKQMKEQIKETREKARIDNANKTEESVSTKQRIFQ